MARILLIIVALVIAAFPHLGLTHTMDAYVTTVLGLFMAAVLLFSKRPKMLPAAQNEVLPQAKPSPFVPPMQELPIAHVKEESFSPVITTGAPSSFSIPSPIETPARKRVRGPSPLVHRSSEEVEVSVPQYVHPATPRRIRKTAPRVTLSEEAQVQPADVPFPSNIDTTDESPVETRP